MPALLITTLISWSGTRLKFRYADSAGSDEILRLERDIRTGYDVLMDQARPGGPLESQAAVVRQRYAEALLRQGDLAAARIHFRRVLDSTPEARAGRAPRT